MPTANILFSQSEISSFIRSRKPSWLRRPKAFEGKQKHVSNLLNACGVHTVCNEAKCPNRSECYAKGTATFLVMGPVCTRGCAFCSVTKGTPAPLDWHEISRVVKAARSMNLRHAVITSVSRDDIPDGGASFFSEMVAAFRRDLPGVTIELLIPDFNGAAEPLASVLKSRPDIINHNIETVPSLYASVRPQADYNRSLSVLQRAAEAGLVTKSGFMVGLGETPEEVFGILDDMKTRRCSVVTIGQYLQPSVFQTGVKEYVPPRLFETYAEYGRKAGIFKVIAGPFVRSSYHAADILEGLEV